MLAIIVLTLFVLALITRVCTRMKLGAYPLWDVFCEFQLLLLVHFLAVFLSLCYISLLSSILPCPWKGLDILFFFSNKSPLSKIESGVSCYQKNWTNSTSLRTVTSYSCADWLNSSRALSLLGFWQGTVTDTSSILGKQHIPLLPVNESRNMLSAHI